MKIRLDRAVTQQNETRDMEISLGIAAVLTVLATKQGWGKVRLCRLWEQTQQLITDDLMPRAPRFTASYIADLEYGFTRLMGELMRKMGKDDLHGNDSR